MRASEATVDLPQHEVERLLMTVTGNSRAELRAGATLTDDQAVEFEEMVGRRRSGEPLQYIEGTVQFGAVELKIDNRALIPRPETEWIWEQIIREVHSPRVIVDLCTGSGALALCLAHSFPLARVIGTDMSEDALALAASNAARTRVELLRGDLWQALPGDLMGSIDLLVANPPYVTEGEFATLPEEIRRHEPKMALLGGINGLEIVERIADQAGKWLRPGGALFCEIGHGQGAQALLLFERDLEAELRLDLADKERLIVAWRR